MMNGNDLNLMHLCGNCFVHIAKGGGCPNCEWEEKEIRSQNALSHGSMLDSGNYYVGRVLGSPSGFGIAYLCLDIKLRERVVIKELFPDKMVHRNGQEVRSYENVRNRFGMLYGTFLEEARTLAEIKHAAVAHIKRYFQENGTAYIVMDYQEGYSLAQLIERNGPMQLEQVLDLLWPIFEGLQQVHNKNITHCDIKPENIFVANEQAILIDFGNAKVNRSENTSSILPGVSPHFSAPELYEQMQDRIGPWSDIYSLCGVIYFCISGERPPDHRTEKDKLNDILYHPNVNNLPEAFRKILARGLKLNPEMRFNSAQQMQDALASFRPQQQVALIWTDALGDDNFAKRMRKIAEGIHAGKRLPLLFSPAACIFQWFWMLGYGMLRVGGLTVAMSGAVLCGVMWDQRLWPWAVLYFLLQATICGFLGETAVYYELNDWAKSQPVRTSVELSQAQNAIRERSKINGNLTVIGLLIFPFMFFTLLLRGQYDNKVIGQIESAIELRQLREKVQEYYLNQHAAPNSFEILGFIPGKDSHIAEMKLMGANVEITFAIPSVQGKKILLSLAKDDSGKLVWLCKNKDVPTNFSPNSCK